MFGFGSYLLCGLAAWSLWSGSLAEERFVCLLDESNPNQCDNFCLTALRPLLNQIAKRQDQGKTFDADSVNKTQTKLEQLGSKLEGQVKEVQSKLEANSKKVQMKLNSQLPLLNLIVQRQEQENNRVAEFVNKSQAKLEHLVGQQAKMEDQLKKDQAKMEGQMKKDQAKLEDQVKNVQTKLEEKLQGMDAKLEEKLQAVQTKLDDQLGEVQAKLKGSLNMVESQLQMVLTKMKDQMQALLTKMDAQQAAIVEIKDRVRNIIPPGFEQIGSRYFRIVQSEQNWKGAVRACQEMGGYLAAIKNEEELNALSKKLENNNSYWLGFNDRDNMGHYVSVASNKTANLNLNKIRSIFGLSGRCLVLHNFTMFRAPCDELLTFICQADNET